METAGSLIQLLRSLEAADYFGLRHPHLTIELPANVDHGMLDDRMQRFLAQFQWPPADPDRRYPPTSRLTVRRRIPAHPFSPLDASARLVESFYPTQPGTSHVLLLAPAVELSPLFYHFLYYHLLEYRYAATLYTQAATDALMGISLLPPATQLDGTTPFSPPPAPPPAGANSSASLPARPATHYLAQAPATAAALYFGPKWLELHAFLSHQVLAGASLAAPALPRSFPAVAQPVLDLARLRAYAFLHAALPAHALASAAHSPATVAPEHRPLPPDAPRGLARKPPAHASPPLAPGTAALTDLLPAPPPPPPGPPADAVSPAALPELDGLPLLAHDGRPAALPALRAAAVALAAAFREAVGGCPAGRAPPARAWRVDDLFCDTADPAELLALPPPEAPAEAPAGGPRCRAGPGGGGRRPGGAGGGGGGLGAGARGDAEGVGCASGTAREGRGRGRWGGRGGAWACVDGGNGGERTGADELGERRWRARDGGLDCHDDGGLDCHGDGGGSRFGCG